MAKLNAYYTLCPLIDQQNLLGVEQDKESGWAIVTLGRNIVIRYKLQDLKQSRSWSSKDKLTSQVIYDKSNQCYAAAFKEKKIRVWSEEEVDLNNVKGYKFRFPLHAILTHDELPPVLVQQNGATASLKWAIANRKSWASKGILRTKEKLLHCQLIHLNKRTSLYCLTKIEETYNCLVVKLTDDTCLEKANTMNRFELKRESEDLVGHTVIQNKNTAYLLTLWSHGRLYSHVLTGTSSDPGASTLISVITNINTKYPAVMTHLNETTIAVYGADITDEGAILMIYNVQHKLAQAVQKLKLYTNDAKLWKVEDKLLLAANRHLAIAPYRLAPQRMAATMSSSLCFENHDNDNDTDDIMVIQEMTKSQWNKKQSHVSKSMSTDRSSSMPQLPKITKQNFTYKTEGWSDTTMQEILIPSFMESGDVTSIYWCLNRTKDLPEKLLVDLLAFLLRSPDKMFVPLQNGLANNVSTSSNSNSHSRNDCLDKVFSITYSSTSLLPHLRTGLTLDEVLRLLEYLMDKLTEQVDSLDGNPQLSEQQLYEWSNLLYDSHHQHYAISQDARVLEVFNRLNSVLDQHVQFLQDLQNLRPVLERIIDGKSPQSSSTKYNKYYSIEEIKLY
ncbi:uncharacterized protein LOC116850634 isoform X2 [Odontomachus brunneus]|uniref:uncharacterized protein LOC116850634 isoform X2 n=1 Tax=Odontomachus brunneus TaxID=486640 RepID=UPI0013F1B297|nr:uncharacterized protein LOC116850634 isoform X2 [Odontomachus brunneus]